MENNTVDNNINQQVEQPETEVAVTESKQTKQQRKEAKKLAAEQKRQRRTAAKAAVKQARAQAIAERQAAIPEDVRLANKLSAIAELQ